MSAISQVRCDQCGKRTDDMAKATGWVEFSAGGRGGIRDIEVVRSTGQGCNTLRRKHAWEPLHFCDSTCLADFVEAI